MENFALITEGITDQAVLEKILCGYYEEDIDVNIIQPSRDATDESRQGNFGGWERVLEHCRLSSFSEIFLFNAYVIIQIDTDIAEHPNFGISYHAEADTKPVSILVNDVKEKIISLIPKDTFERFKDRIFFAVAVHSLECWLLPLHSNTPSTAKKIVNCENTLNQILSKKNIQYEKGYRTYEDLSEQFLKKRNLLVAKTKNESLSIFLDSLPLKSK